MANDEKILRVMGSNEAYQTAVHTLDQYRGTIVACRYCQPQNNLQPLDYTKLQFDEAFKRTILTQRHLLVGYQGENTPKPAFVPLKEIDLRESIQWVPCDDETERDTKYKEIMQAQVDKRFDDVRNKPGWRIVILHSTDGACLDVVYVWNHAHHDGMSGKIFHEQLLRHLNRIAREQEHLRPSEDSIIHLSNAPEMLPPLAPNPEILTSWPASWRYLANCVWRAFKPNWFPPRNTLHATWAPIQLQPYETRSCNFTLDYATVEKVVAQCRTHKTTVTGLLNALVCVSLTHAVKTAQGFASRTPYDLRKILPEKTPQYPELVPKDIMCNYVGVVDHEYETALINKIRGQMAQAQDKKSSLPPDALETAWSLATRIRQEIEKRLELGTQDDMIAVMKLVSDWRAQQTRDAGKDRYFSWVVTNLGVIDGGGERDAWSLQKAELLMGAETTSAVFGVSIVSVKGREMRVTCTWPGYPIDPQLGVRLMGDLERWLRDIAA
ncbi:hypothetical protein M011DRAFT_186565 [Sporormia fimetaria CBS 119925]|uniref:Alcohol acetyltransferase n=1 Tax=Sporormia fimetaria CBS 119925 TaxID=1340428 RepID=A0A6A6VM66_9PLEO|nr:hypothetical protein M011DRAFT_186565 [Sporormia fimetaria CBS 119925]